MSKRLFNAQNAVVPTYFQRVLLSILIVEGHKPEQLLAGLELSVEDFVNDDCRITPLQNIQFIKNALKASRDPHLGWRFGEQLQITTLGVLGYALMSADNVSTAVETLTVFFKIREPSFDLKIIGTQIETSLSVVEINESYDFEEIRYFMMSCIASAFDHVFTDLTRQKGIIKKLELTCAEPENWEAQTRIQNFPVTFNSSANRLYLEEGFLNKGIPTADPYTERSMMRICQEVLSAVEDQSGIIKEIKEFIIASTGGYPSLNETASHLCISPRTLRRELHKSNTTYQRLLDSVRANIAKELILNTVKTTYEIGVELGYNDASNFSRAFKSWTGVNPSEFRLKTLNSSDS